MTEAPALGLRDVRAAVHRSWVRQSRPERMLLLRGRPEWQHDPVVQVDEVQVRVVGAVSPLAVREALATYPEERLVVLTAVPEASLGVDLLSRAVRQRVGAVDLWESVRTSFGVTRPDALDRSVVRDGEVLAQALLDLAPPGGWPTPSSGVLTREHAYRSLAAEVLGTPRDLDAAGLLDWTRDARGTLALRDMEPRLRGLLTAWMLQRTGAGTRPVLELAVSGQGTDALPLGLVAGLAWTAGTERGQGRVEQVVGRGLSGTEARAWAGLSEGWVLRRLGSDPASAWDVLDDADRVLDELGAASLAGASELLPSGLHQRAKELAESLPAAVSSPGPRTLGVIERALARLAAHQLALGAETFATLSMAVRLVRWLAGAPTLPEHALAALSWQVVEGGWVDRARQVVANGVGDPLLGVHLAAVHEAASVRRAEIDRVAARHVADAVRADQPFGRLVPVEDALRDLVKPLAVSSPVLLLVLDGMSAAVANEVVESAVGLGWVEHQRDPGAGRDVLMAGLPTVTEVSRTSLLSGRLQKGGQREERNGIREVLGDETVLFHLRDLLAGAGRDLPDDVREAVQDGKRPVVATVLNAVDDSLSGGDPARTRWTVDNVRHLRQMLERARAAGRVVVLTSDHGHVVDAGPDGDVQFNRSGGGARWRPGADDLREDEVRLTGRRVQLGGGDIVAAVSERLRYKQRSEGYHGGAALAELAIPFVVLARRGDAVAGYAEVGSVAPEWWDRARETDWAGAQDEETLFA